jgi:hypothetical protein
MSMHSPTGDVTISDVVDTILKMMRQSMSEHANGGNPKWSANANIQDSDRDFATRWRAEAETLIDGDGVACRMRYGYVGQFWKYEGTASAVPSGYIGERVPA